jgi:hypothetical protein
LPSAVCRCPLSTFYLLAICTLSACLLHATCPRLPAVLPLLSLCCFCSAALQHCLAPPFLCCCLLSAAVNAAAYPSLLINPFCTAHCLPLLPPTAYSRYLLNPLPATNA